MNENTAKINFVDTLVREYVGIKHSDADVLLFIVELSSTMFDLIEKNVQLEAVNEILEGGM
jgi:hypothetical protein